MTFIGFEQDTHTRLSLCLRLPFLWYVIAALRAPPLTPTPHPPPISTHPTPTLMTSSDTSADVIGHLSRLCLTHATLSDTRSPSLYRRRPAPERCRRVQSPNRPLSVGSSCSTAPSPADRASLTGAQTTKLRPASPDAHHDDRHSTAPAHRRPDLTFSVTDGLSVWRILRVPSES